MTTFELLKISLTFLAVSIAALGLGAKVIDLMGKSFFKEEDDITPLEKLGLCLFAGYGSLGYILIILGLAGFFYQKVIIGVLAATILLTCGDTLYYIRALPAVPKFIFKVLQKDPLFVLQLAIIAAVLMSLYLTSMLPPYASDEIAYHMPEAKLIAESHHFYLNLGGHYFYGNIPKLVEVLFALGITLFGYALAHLLHFVFLLAFLATAGGLIGRLYGYRSGTLFVFLLVFYNELVWNASVGFVDAAAVGLEVSGLLYALNWLENRRRRSFLYSALLFGIAMSIKYSPLATLGFSLLVILLDLVVKRFSLKNITRMLLPFIIILFLFGGFFYLKNIVLYGNPFYPLYFGHRGVGEQAYLGLVNAIQQFGPKSFGNFIRTPFNFYTFNQIYVFLGFCIFPLVLTVREHRRFNILLFSYILTYWLYWFFLATHQIRFLMPAVIAILCAAAIFLGKLKSSFLPLALFAILVIGVSFNRHYKSYYFSNSLKLFKDNMIIRQDKIPYALGRETAESFLAGQYGCQYSVFNAAKSEGPGSIIDNWSVWHDPAVGFFAVDNKLVEFRAESSFSDIKRELEAKNIRYLYIKSDTKARHLNNPDPEVVEHRRGRFETEEYLLSRSDLVYKEGKCELYKINLAKH